MTRAKRKTANKSPLRPSQLSTLEEILKNLPPYLTSSSLPIDNKEIEIGYQHWLKSFEFSEFDAWVKCSLTLDSSLAPVEQLKNSRKALNFSINYLAEKLNVNRSTCRRLEAREKNGSISIKLLQDAAEAIDCELVYVIRPKDRKTFSEIVWEHLLAETRNHGYLKKCVANRRPFALNRLICDRADEAKFRRKLGWTKRKNSGGER